MLSLILGEILSAVSRYIKRHYKRVTVRRELYEKLRELADKEGVTMPSLIARMYELYIQHGSQLSSHEVERKLSELTLRLDSALKTIQVLQESDRVLAEKLSALESRVNALKGKCT
jgi:predicted DNA-binding ribbon-helix-helix protein